MIRKTETHQYLFETTIERFEGRRGTITASNVIDHINVATPPEFAGGIAGLWSPEQLFLGSLGSCMMATYLAIAEKKKLVVVDFKCNAIGLVQWVEGHLEFTKIDVYPKVFVKNEEDKELANEVLLKTYQHCIIANSVVSVLVHHGEVLLAVDQFVQTQDLDRELIT